MSALGIPLIVNDRADIAIAAGAAGCHLGPEDVPVSAIRKIAPPGFIIGYSVGNDDEIANSRGADYAGVGPVFETPTKPDAGTAIGVEGFAKIAAKLGIPAIGIGGISAQNARSVIDAGGVGVAAIAAIFGAADVKRAAGEIARALK